MRLAPIVERLKANGLTKVHCAVEFAGLKGHPGLGTNYFVIPEGWTASPSKTTGVHDQALAEGFSVVIVMDGEARREDAVSEKVDEEEAKVIDAIAGWRHPDASRACEAASARLLSVSGTTLSWMVTFRTGRHIRKAAEA